MFFLIAGFVLLIWTVLCLDAMPRYMILIDGILSAILVAEGLIYVFGLTICN